MRLAKAKKVDILSGLALFEHCTKRELGEVAAVSVVSTVAPGAVLTREGQQGGLAYVVVAGTVKATRKGRRVVMLGPGSIVGELSLLDGGPRTATVTAVDDVSLLEINGDDFARLIAHSPHFTANLLRTLAGRVRATDRRLDLLG